MDKQNRENLAKLLNELRGIRVRLLQISDASFDDMEGSDAPDYFISEELYTGLGRVAKHIGITVEKCEHLASPNTNAQPTAGTPGGTKSQ